jgi:hypothetical protein
LILSQDQTLVEKFLLTFCSHFTNCVFELTHGPTYLVFKHQLRFCFLQAKLLIIQKPFSLSSRLRKLFRNSLFDRNRFPQGQIRILYMTLSVVKACNTDYTKFLLNFVNCRLTSTFDPEDRLVEVRISKSEFPGFPRKESPLKFRFKRTLFPVKLCSFSTEPTMMKSLHSKLLIFFELSFFSN